MTKNYKTGLSVFIFFIISVSASAQQNLFSRVNENLLKSAIGQRVIVPMKYNTFSLNVQKMSSFLSALPSDHIGIDHHDLPVLELPMPDGTLARFNVWESSIMEPGLQEKFPEIRTYTGQGIDDPVATLKMDYSPYFGFSAQVLSAKGSFYIDPYARGDINYYNSYYGSDYQRQTGFVCENPEQTLLENNYANAVVVAKCRGTQLYKYRLAIACTGEYAIAATGLPTPTVAQTLSRIVTTINRVDGVYETELSIHLTLVASEANVIFTNPATDPFTGNNSATTLINESQLVMTTYIGSSNYDIGHTFSTGGGGLATVGCVCSTLKARGITGSPNPVGDAYDIDYVAHEMGHQFGANHSFNSTMANCSGNWYSLSAYEVGSGTSIMGYAGICSNDNIQPHSDPFFHTISFDEISKYVEAGGASCRVISSTGNTLPVITAMNNNGAYIPRYTPFTLTGAATDANGDPLTYSWEEWDLGASTAWNAGTTSTTAPLFKSRVPSVSGSRTFPDMSVILAGYPVDPAAAMSGLRGETLPAVARAMKFRLTVRDNRAGGGGVVTGGSGCQSSFTGTYQINVVATSGPFAVTLPNGGESYTGGMPQTITWNVVGTTASPISCANVKISMSTDGGLTYPIILIASTPNDGSQLVTMPQVVSSSARIKIEAVGNIFFDISDANFSINAPTSCGDPTGLSNSSITTTSATIGWTTVGYANNYDVDYKATADSAWINIATATASTSVNLSGLNQSTSYDWRVRANCSIGASNYMMSQFTTATPPPPCPGPYDISTNGTITGAAQIPLNTNIMGKIDSKTDIDYYKFIITTGGTISVSLTTLPANFDLSLHNSTGTQLAISKNTGTANELINATVAAGTYYAKVLPNGNAFSTASCYTLKVVPGTASKPGGEENPITGPIVFPNPVIQTASVIVPGFEGNPDLIVYDMLGRLVLKKTTNSKSKMTDFSVLPAGMYMLKLMNNGVALGNVKFVKN